MRFTQTVRLAVSGIIAASVLAACSKSNEGDSPSVGNYAVKGKLTSLSVMRAQSVGALSSGDVTHVMAVSPVAYSTRFVSAVNADGTFSLNIEAGKPYVIVFIDSTKTGKNMVLGMFNSNTLDSLAPLTAGGSTELGDVTIQNDGAATASVPYADLIASLGLSTTAASSLGELDDLCLRYVNPDIDGDGVIDALQENRNFVMDFHVQLPMQKADNSNIKVDDILNEYFPTTSKFNYGGTGVIAAYPKTFSTATTGTFAYNAGGTWPVTITDYSSGSPADVVLSSGGAATDKLQSSGYGDMATLMVPTKSTSELPKGELTYTFGGKTLTFTHVKVPANAELVSGEGRFAPFIKINTSPDSCTSNCDITSIDYKWMRNNGTAWVAATQEELNALVSESGGHLSIRYRTLSESKNAGASIPRITSGNIPWTASSMYLEGGLTGAELEAMTEADLCNVGLSYDDLLGVRYFFGIEKATSNSTCN